MANEFIIKNGYVSKGDSQVSGSLNVGTTATEHKLTITGKTYPTIELLANATYQGVITSNTSTVMSANSNGLILQPGNNTAANGGGGNLTLGGGNSTSILGLKGGDVRIIGGYSGNSSRDIGEVFISGSLIDLRGPVTGSFTGSYTGSFVGDGSALTGLSSGTVVTGNGGGSGDTLSTINIGGTTFTVATGTGNGTVDTSGTPIDDDYAKFTDGNTIEGRSASEVRTDLGLVIGTNVQGNSAELTAISELATTDSGVIVGNGSTFVLETGTTLRTSLGVDAAGTDNSTNVSLTGTPDYITISGQTITRNQIDLTADVTGVLPSANLDSDTAHLTGTQTFSGAKLFSAGLTITGNNYIQFLGTSGGGGEGIKFLDTADGNREALHFPGNNLVVLSNRSSNGIIEIRSNNSTPGSSGETLSARFTATGSFVSKSLAVEGSGSGIFSVEGSIGSLFSVDDGLDDVIFAANNVSGTPVISANADNTVQLGKLGGFGIVISGSTPAPNDSQAKIIITGSIHTSGSLGVGMAANSTIGRIDAKNDVVAFSTSDKRLKDNITPIENALNKISQVQGIEFDWIPKEGVHGNEGHDVGVIAQEIEKVLPEVVTTRDNGYKAVKYEKIIPLLVEAIKELQEEIKELKKDK